MDNQRTITITDSYSGAVLAEAKLKNGVRLFEGSWYFDPEAVDMVNLVVTKRTYTCPYKGICYWIDLVAPDHEARNVAWTYFKVKPGYEFIRDKIAFYAGRRPGTIEVQFEAPVSVGESKERRSVDRYQPTIVLVD